MSTSALEILQNTFGYKSFRDQQATIVSHVSAGGDALVLMPTGGGKSLCYQIPSLLRDGLAIIVSPLIALMQNQVEALQQLGVNAAFLNSSLSMDDTQTITTQALRGELKILYVAPERLMANSFLQFLEQVNNHVGLALFAIDEHTAFLNGDMTLDPSIDSSQFCMSVFLMYQESHLPLQQMPQQGLK